MFKTMKYSRKFEKRNISLAKNVDSLMYRLDDAADWILRRIKR